jgi:hypothetical protein
VVRDKAEFSAMDTDCDSYVSKSEAAHAAVSDYPTADKHGEPNKSIGVRSLYRNRLAFIDSGLGDL